jgi:hypothetical protein
MRSISVAFVVAVLSLAMAPGGPAQAQGVRIGPGGVEITPGPERRGPPPGAVVRDELASGCFACVGNAKMAIDALAFASE